MNNLQKYGKYSLVGIQLTGLLLSAFIVALTFINIKQVEERVQSFAIGKVQSKVDAVWEETASQPKNSGRVEKLKNLAKRFGVESDDLQEQRRKIVPALLAKALSNRCSEKCSFWLPLAAIKNSEFLEEIRNRKIGQTTLNEFVLERYEKYRGRACLRP